MYRYFQRLARESLETLEVWGVLSQELLTDGWHHSTVPPSGKSTDVRNRVHPFSRSKMGKVMWICFLKRTEFLVKN